MVEIRALEFTCALLFCFKQKLQTGQPTRGKLLYLFAGVFEYGLDENEHEQGSRPRTDLYT